MQRLFGSSLAAALIALAAPAAATAQCPPVPPSEALARYSACPIPDYLMMPGRYTAKFRVDIPYSECSGEDPYDMSCMTTMGQDLRGPVYNVYRYSRPCDFCGGWTCEYEFGYTKFATGGRTAGPISAHMAQRAQQPPAPGMVRAGKLPPVPLPNFTPPPAPPPEVSPNDVESIPMPKPEKPDAQPVGR